MILKKNNPRFLDCWIQYVLQFYIIEYKQEAILNERVAYNL